MSIEVDITAEDRDERPFLVAKATYDELTPEVRRDLLDALDADNPEISFFLLVDPGTLRIYRRDDEGHPSEVAELDAAEVIGHYAPGYTKANAERRFKPIFRIFLVGMARSWLSDLAGRWHEGEPPKRDVVDRIGLLDRLAGGLVTDEELLRD